MPFKDQAEARRYRREWSRRKFKARRRNWACRSYVEYEGLIGIGLMIHSEQNPFEPVGFLSPKHPSNGNESTSRNILTDSCI